MSTDPAAGCAGKARVLKSRSSASRRQQGGRGTAVGTRPFTSDRKVWNNPVVVAQLDSALARTLLSGAAGVDVDRDAVETAVNQQLIHGGALDTLLLEAGVVDEPTVARALSQAWRTVAVATTAFDEPDPRAVALLPARMAVAMGLVPFQLDADGTLHVACRAPLDAGLISEVGALIRADVVAHVVPEVRLLQGLAAAYDHELGERFVSLLRHLAPLSKAVLAAGLTATDADTSRPADEPIVSWDLVEAMAHLAAQDSRDGIARVAVAYARRFLPFAAVFGVRDNAAVGWHRSGPSEGLQFAARPFPIPADGFLAQALSSPSPLLLKPELGAGNAAVFGWLGRRRPKTVLVVPIVVARRPVGALYADGGIRQRDPREVGELVGFSARLGPAFESLLRQRHRAHPSLFPQPALTIPPTAVEPMILKPAIVLPGPPPMPPMPSSLPAPPAWTASTPPASSMSALSSLSMASSSSSMASSMASSSLASLLPAGSAAAFAVPSMPVPAVTMPAIVAPQSLLSPPPDGSSPFARGYVTPAPPSPLPAPPPFLSPSLSSSASSVSSLASLPRRPSSIVLSGIGAPLNEHLPRQMAVPASSLSTTSALFAVGDDSAPDAWRGALRDTVEKGLQGGSAAALPDDDDDLNWEAVVYDPAHAAELDKDKDRGRADRAERTLDFPSLSSSTLADLYGNGGDDSDTGTSTTTTLTMAATTTTAPTPATTDGDDNGPGWSTATTTPPSAAVDPEAASALPVRDPPLATMSHRELVELLFAGDDDLVARASRELVSRGLAAVPALGERFPGRLRVDPFDPGENVRTTAALGPLVDVLGRLGNDGLDAAVTHVDSRYPAHRFAAVLLFALTPDSRAMDLLRSRLHDAEPRVQRLAAEALMPFLAHPRFETLLVHLRERAAATTKPYPVEARRRATELLGEFRDVGAIPLLMTLLGFNEMQEPARHALRAITLQDFGARPKAWEKWWARAKKRSRLDWLLEALSSEELSLRSAAHRELADLAGDDFGYRADADKRSRQRAVDVWVQWWAEEQRRAPQPRAAARL